MIGTLCIIFRFAADHAVSLLTSSGSPCTLFHSIGRFPARQNGRLTLDLVKVSFIERRYKTNYAD